MLCKTTTSQLWGHDGEENANLIATRPHQLGNQSSTAEKGNTMDS